VAYITGVPPKARAKDAVAGDTKTQGDHTV
jgi:hypothetical protein